jgi:transposase InsO family protein
VRGAQGEKKPLGRPAHSEVEKRQVLLSVRRLVNVLGWTAGWRPMDYMLDAPTRLIQTCLSAIKARHRRKVREHRAANRTSVKVLAKDVIWTQDAAQVAMIGEMKVPAEVVKDRGTLGNVAMAAGRPAKGRDIVEMLARKKQEGCLPLVLATDNGSTYTSKRVSDFCKQEKVVHLFSRTHTPQDNGAAERGIGELKAEIGQNPCFRAVRDVAACLSEVWAMLDNRPRASKGYKSAVQLEKELPAGQELVDRDTFYKATCREVEKAVQGGGTPREKRQAERLAILRTLEEHQLIHIIRGGKTCPA